MSLRIHAICLALNEEVFIENQLKTLYPFCSGISILTQYDRDWYGKAVNPDKTIYIVANFPDPEGKIQLVIRRWPDEAAARNSEMLCLLTKSHRGIISHGSPTERIINFHRKPDYFLIVDADELYDAATLPRMIEHLQKKSPRGMRVLGYNYSRTWNRRVPISEVRFCQFGFLRPGILFKMRRTVSWNESRVGKLLRMCCLPDISSWLWGFINCPPELGMFHHGCWLGNDERLKKKTEMSSHRKMWDEKYPRHIDAIPTTFVSREDLPLSISRGKWPDHFFDPPQSPMRAKGEAGAIS